MKKLLFWGALLFAGIVLTACGGGSSDNTTTQGGDGVTTSGFTTELLDGNPTYYVTYPGDSEETTDQGTTQEVIAITGSGGTYQATITSTYFDAADALVSTTSFTMNFTLNQDGTFTASDSTDPSYTITATLAGETSNYLDIDFADSTGDTWSDLWYFAQPAGWLTDSAEPLAFVAADFNDSVVYEIWEEVGGTLGAGGWAGTTIQFNSDGTASGADGIVNPFVAEITGATWEIDAEGRLHISAGSENYFTLTARSADYFEVCWGETATDADGCADPEYLFTDLAAANAFVATAP